MTPDLSTLPRKDTEPFPARQFVFPCASVAGCVLYIDETVWV